MSESEEEEGADKPAEPGAETSANSNARCAPLVALLLLKSDKRRGHTAR